MDDNQPVPYMRLSTSPLPRTPRVRRGMTLNEVREIYHARADAKSAEIMRKYEAQKQSGGGREGLGIYQQFASRAADARTNIAVQLLESAGLTTDDATIRKLRNR